MTLLAIRWGSLGKLQVQPLPTPLAEDPEGGEGFSVGGQIHGPPDAGKAEAGGEKHGGGDAGEVPEGGGEEYGEAVACA